MKAEITVVDWTVMESMVTARIRVKALEGEMEGLVRYLSLPGLLLPLDRSKLMEHIKREVAAYLSNPSTDQLLSSLHLIPMELEI